MFGSTGCLYGWGVNHIVSHILNRCQFITHRISSTAEMPNSGAYSVEHRKISKMNTWKVCTFTCKHNKKYTYRCINAAVWYYCYKILLLIWLTSSKDYWSLEQSFTTLCIALVWGCFSVCQQRVSDTVRNILLSSTNNILEWNGPSLGCNESWVMCCFWRTFGLMHAERQMQASVHIQTCETLRGKRECRQR